MNLIEYVATAVLSVAILAAFAVFFAELLF